MGYGTLKGVDFIINVACHVRIRLRIYIIIIHNNSYLIRNNRASIVFLRGITADSPTHRYDPQTQHFQYANKSTTEIVIP